MKVSGKTILRNLLHLRALFRGTGRRHKLVLRAVLLVAVYSLLTLAAMAQEPVGKAGEPQKLTARGKKELSSAPAKVDVSPVARDEEIVKRLPDQSLHEKLDAVSTKAEAGLYSEAVVIEEQARQAQPLKTGANLTGCFRRSHR